MTLVSGGRNLEKFWMVVGAGSTTIRHKTKAEAVKEALRISEKTPGLTVYVTEAIFAYAPVTTFFQLPEKSSSTDEKNPYKKFGNRHLDWSGNQTDECMCE